MKAEDFPTDYEGYTLAQSWLISVRHPEVWLTRVANERGFTPKKNPYEMTPPETQQAIANVLCPKRDWDISGVAVNFEMTMKQTGVCHAVYYTAEPINWETVRHFVHETHFEPTRSSAQTLLRFLERGGRKTSLICPPLKQGLPIGDNIALCRGEAERRRKLEEERQRKEFEKWQTTIDENMGMAGSSPSQ